MKQRLAKIGLSVLTAALALPIWADIATPINIHGQLLSSTGEPVSGTRAFVVSFFDAATNGNALGTPITDNVEVSADGLFNLTVQPPFEIFSVEEVWYALGVDTDEPADNDASDDIFPSRIRVYYVPLAVQAHRALSVDADGVGMGTVDDTELDMLNGVTSNVQTQIDAIDTEAIAEHATDIAQNTTDIATNTADIADNTTAIATNTTNIATNTSDIADNATAIATNTADIADNTTAIATNTTNIATNTSDIADNATAIALKANIADVYSQSAADAKFVELAGDTMSGPLGVDVIFEATPDNGVVVDGVKLQDNFVELTAITAPGDTTGKLYRTGADLFWNGSQINGGGGGDTDTLQWNAFYVYDLGDPITVYEHVMSKQGIITSFQISCGNGPADWTVDFHVNGVSILLDGPAEFVGGSLQLPTLSDTIFTASDVFKLILADGTDEINGVSISIIVEYY